MLSFTVRLLALVLLLGFAPLPGALAETVPTHTSNPTPTPGDRPTVGLALGGGGANGLAHIVVLETLDEMGIRPHRIAGSSIGAIIGALYASGMSGSEIRQLVEDFTLTADEALMEELLDEDALRWVDFIQLDLGQGGLMSSEGFMSYLYQKLHHNEFEKLQIPMKIVAADYWERRQVVFESGELLSAIKASMALPGVFKPVRREGRVLIDGGTVNPVPYDLLKNECDIVIAVDVNGLRSGKEGEIPGYFSTIFNSVKIMHAAIMQEKRRFYEPDIYLSPPIKDIRALEFYKAEDVFAQAEPTRAELKQKLEKILAERTARH